MGRKTYKAEQIIGKLWEAEVLLSRGSTVGEASKKIGVTKQTYYRWRREYGGMGIKQARRLKEREGRNSRLKKLVADLSLDNAIPKEATRTQLGMRSDSAAISLVMVTSLDVCGRGPTLVSQPALLPRYPLGPGIHHHSFQLMAYGCRHAGKHDEEPYRIDVEAWQSMSSRCPIMPLLSPDAPVSRLSMACQRS